jgi:hypothetical protein
MPDAFPCFASAFIVLFFAAQSEELLEREKRLQTLGDKMLQESGLSDEECAEYEKLGEWIEMKTAEERAAAREAKEQADKEAAAKAAAERAALDVQLTQLSEERQAIVSKITLAMGAGKKNRESLLRKELMQIDKKRNDLRRKNGPV